MNIKSARLSLALALAVCAGFAHADKDPYDEAMHVYGCADYPKAFRLFVPLAEQGNSLAQFQVGMMTEQGQGTDPDMRQAFDWYMKAAMQGMADAYFALGQMFSRGEVVSKDPVQAYAWFDLAQRAGHAVAGDWLRLEKARLTAADFPRAEEIIRAWQAKVAGR